MRVLVLALAVAFAGESLHAQDKTGHIPTVFTQSKISHGMIVVYQL